MPQLPHSQVSARRFTRVMLSFPSPVLRRSAFRREFRLEMFPERSAAAGAGRGHRGGPADRGVPHLFRPAASPRLFHGPGGPEAERPEVCPTFRMLLFCRVCYVYTLSILSLEHGRGNMDVGGAKELSRCGRTGNYIFRCKAYFLRASSPLQRNAVMVAVLCCSWKFTRQQQ